MASGVDMRVTFMPEQKLQNVTQATVNEALRKIQVQIQSGATAGNLRLNGQTDSDVVPIHCRVRWSIDGEVDM